MCSILEEKEQICLLLPTCDQDREHVSILPLVFFQEAVGILPKLQSLPDEGDPAFNQRRLVLFPAGGRKKHLSGIRLGLDVGPERSLPCSVWEETAGVSAVWLLPRW